MRGGPRYGRTNREVGQYRMKRRRRLVGFCTRAARVRDACSGMRRALVRLQAATADAMRRKRVAR